MMRRKINEAERLQNSENSDLEGIVQRVPQAIAQPNANADAASACSTGAGDSSDSSDLEDEESVYSYHDDDDLAPASLAFDSPILGLNEMHINPQLANAGLSVEGSSSDEDEDEDEEYEEDEECDEEYDEDAESENENENENDNDNDSDIISESVIASAHLLRWSLLNPPPPPSTTPPPLQQWELNNAKCKTDFGISAFNAHKRLCSAKGYESPDSGSEAEAERAAKASSSVITPRITRS